MLNTLAKSISTCMRGLFCCGCSPEPGDGVPEDNKADRNGQGTRLNVIVDDPSDVAWDTPTAPISEKSSHSASNGSVSDKNGVAVTPHDTAAQGVPPNGTNYLPIHQDTVVEPNMLSLGLDMQNRSTHQEALAQHLQIPTGHAEVAEEGSTVPSIVVEGSDETMVSQNLLVRKEVVQSNAVEEGTPSTWQRQGDVTYDTFQGSVTGNNASQPLSMEDGQNPWVPPASEPHGTLAQVRARQAEILVDTDEVDGAQLSPGVQEKMPRKKVDLNLEVKAGGDQPLQIVKEKLPRRKMVVEESVENAYPSHLTSDRMSEAEDDHLPQIMKGNLPRKRMEVEEEIVEKAQPSRIPKVSQESIGVASD